MKFTKAFSTISLALAGVLAGHCALADVPADVDTSLDGTYELTYAFAQSGSPFTNGYTSTFVINGGEESLCVNGSKLNDAYLRSAGEAEILWNEEVASGSVAYGLSTKTDGSFNEINVYTLNGSNQTWVGQFTGSRTSTDTTCAGALGLSADALTAVDLAEEIFPELFPFDGGSEFFEIKGYIARYYAETKVYVGFKDGHVFVVGGPFGDKIIDKGAEADVVTKLENAKISIGNPGGCDEEATGQLGCGEWDITITGTVSQSAPVALTTDLPETVLEDIPMNNPANEEEIKQVLIDAYEDAGSISNIVVDIVTNTEDHVVLDVAFDSTITQQGVTVNSSYDLHFDMTR